MGREIQLELPLNRAEGDLELKVAVRDGVIVDAWSSGTMFRGFELMLEGRAPLDGLVITPRICGICSLTHLYAAALALDRAAGVEPPPNAVRSRNAALLTETIQSDVRQALLMYLVDFTNPAFGRYRWHQEALRRYAPLSGERVLAAVAASKSLLGVIALLGGQWPHTSFMVPGGVVSTPVLTDLFKARNLVRDFRHWYEDSVLGCSVEQWLELRSAKDLEQWLEEEERHRASDVGFLLRAGREVGLARLGVRRSGFLSFGAFAVPDDSAVVAAGGRGKKGKKGERLLLPSGFVAKSRVSAFDQRLITEDLSYAWYDGRQVGVHPGRGKTHPFASGREGDKYSWVKAPRYREQVAETGPLAERLVAGDPLFTDLVAEQGASALVRQLARMARPVYLFSALETWLDELSRRLDEKFYYPVKELRRGEGVGMLQAARGALGHWLTIENGKIARYQIITPTAWNGSPRDGRGRRGPWEEALIGTPVPDPEDPVLAGLAVRSFDPCLVCAVHVAGTPARRVLRV